jgi:hypothetical protein
MAIGRQDFEERRENKINTYTERARKSNVLANQELKTAQDMGSAIPFGQPILVGHHSEKRHRALLKRIDAAHHRASEAGDKAAYYQDKADTAENNHSISGDDCEAVKRYQAKLEKLETGQELMKAINKAWKQGKNALYELGLSDETIENLKHKMPSYETKPFPTWALSNNSAEIRRVKEKLEELKRLDQMEAENITFNGGEMKINLEINRIQFIFDDIPSKEIRGHLKSNGFKWAPSEKAWQRQRTTNAVHAAKRLIKEHFTE